MKECCEGYGISRQAGYKVRGKYREYGEAGLEENSRAPHASQPDAGEDGRTGTGDAAATCAGGRAAAGSLLRNQPEAKWPAASTIGAMLDREGLAIGVEAA